MVVSHDIHSSVRKSPRLILVLLVLGGAVADSQYQESSWSIRGGVVWKAGAGGDVG